MTHSGGKPHANVGYRGQRYEVRATGWPKDEKSVIGWAHEIADAERLAESISRAPGCTSIEIFDLAGGAPVITRYAGILR